jgi:hypothetical protein
MQLKPQGHRHHRQIHLLSGVWRILWLYRLPLSFEIRTVFLLGYQPVQNDLEW